jgi:hypothetical protein
LAEENLPPVQEKEMCIVGLSRSGNHAVINWLLNQLQEPYLFLNCAEPKTNPFDTARPLNEAGRTFSTNIEDFNYDAEKTATAPKRQVLLYNYEDSFLGPLGKKAERQKMQQWVGPSGLRKEILILRDPFNLFASRIKAGLKPPLAPRPRAGTTSLESTVSSAILPVGATHCHRERPQRCEKTTPTRGCGRRSAAAERNGTRFEDRNRAPRASAS